MGVIDSLLLIFLLIGGTAAYVFSCEEVKYRLINKNLQEPTQYVCLVPEEGYTGTDAFKQIYVQVDKVSTSFADLLNAVCIQRPASGSWRIVADTPFDLDCTKEFSLIFTSSNPPIFAVQEQGIQIPETPVVFVAPRTGIRLQMMNRRCMSTGNITVYTGAGNGVSEYRFPMKSWTCAEFPDWIVSFENVITVIPDDGVSYNIGFSLHSPEKPINVSPGDKFVVMASGRSDNLQNLRPELNSATFVASKSTLFNWRFDGSFDARYDVYVNMTLSAGAASWTYPFYGGDGSPGEGSAQQIDIVYAAEVLAPQDIWDNDDNFVFEADLFGDSQEQTTTTQKPNVIDADPYCGCGLDKKFGMPDGWDPTEIWLDVVIILDTSEAMGDVSLVDASTLIESFFGSEDGDVLITNTNAQFYTRVGLIAMSDTAEVLFNLNMTKADNVLGKAQIKKGLTQIDVAAAFSAAEQMLVDGQMSSPERPNVRQVVYYMTNSDPKAVPDPITQFRNSDGIIIVNNFIGANDIERPGLQRIASPGYYSKDIQDNYMASIQLFCKANCFCRKEKSMTPYAGHTTDPAVQAAGGCFNAAPIGVPFSKTRSNCDNLGGGLIASVHDDDKLGFVAGLMHDSAASSDYFWIGYQKSDAGWRWEDQSTNPFTKWDTDNGEPSQASVAKCAYVDTTTPNMFWGAGNCNVGFPSVCEFAPCAVGNNNC